MMINGYRTPAATKLQSEWHEVSRETKAHKFVLRAPWHRDRHQNVPRGVGCVAAKFISPCPAGTSRTVSPPRASGPQCSSLPVGISRAAEHRIGPE